MRDWKASGFLKRNPGYTARKCVNYRITVTINLLVIPAGITSSVSTVNCPMLRSQCKHLLLHTIHDT